MKTTQFCSAAFLFVVLSGCCGVSKTAVKDASHAINGSADVAKAQMVHCKKHDAKACEDVESKLTAIITKSNELESLTK